jgi:TolB-like protein
MSDVFISYARSTAKQANAAAEALRSLGYSVWLDDELLAHHAYTHTIEAQLNAAKAALVIWSTEAVKSEWVLSEANRAREDRKLVQLKLDGARLPMPFDQTQCMDLTGWSGDANAPGWRKVVASIAELTGAGGSTAVATPPPLPSKPSIVVMPFANLSGDPAQDYFSDGMVVEIVEALSRIRSIFVIGSGSTLSFKGKAASPQEAARQLGVRYVLEGSVRKAGDRVRIGVQLTDAADAVQIWTHRFEDTLDDVFALQDRVAISVAAKIEPTVEQAEIRRESGGPTDSVDSYDLYLRAVSRFRVFSKAEIAAALDLLSRAIVLDPGNAPALALAASCHRSMVIYGWSDDADEGRRQGIELAHRAVQAAGDDASVLASVANDLAFLERDMPAAVAIADRAVALNPGSANAWFNSAAARLLAGDLERGIEQIATSARLDPTGPNRAARALLTAVARFYQRRFGEAVGLAKEVIQLAPSPGAYAILTTSLAQLGQIGAAGEALARYQAMTPMPMETLARSFTIVPDHLKLLLDAIALAESGNPVDLPPRA